MARQSELKWQTWSDGLVSQQFGSIPNLWEGKLSADVVPVYVLCALLRLLYPPQLTTDLARRETIRQLKKRFVQPSIRPQLVLNNAFCAFFIIAAVTTVPWEESSLSMILEN
jgi:hypothetical protein